MLFFQFRWMKKKNAAFALFLPILNLCPFLLIEVGKGSWLASAFVGKPGFSSSLLLGVFCVCWLGLEGWGRRGLGLHVCVCFVAFSFDMLLHTYTYTYIHMHSYLKLWCEPWWSAGGHLLLPIEKNCYGKPQTLQLHVWNSSVKAPLTCVSFFFRIVSNFDVIKTLTLVVYAVLFLCSIIHRTLTWTASSFTCICDIFACVYTWGTSVYSLIWRTFVESTQNLTPEKSQGAAKPSTEWSPIHLVTMLDSA